MVMAMAHDHFRTRIRGPYGCYALLAKDATIAVVFVHGFFGNSKDTWVNFQGLIDRFQDSFPQWGTSDLFFYSYASHDQIKPLADDFSKFVRQLFGLDENGRQVRPIRLTPEPLRLPSGKVLIAPFERTKPYDRLILVGHSTGALLIREAMLQQVRQSGASVTFFSSALLRLFAPAHRGALCSGELGAGLRAPVSEWLLSPILYSNPLFANLQPNCPALEDLRRETEELQQRYPDVLGLRAVSLFGSNEAIVTVGRYKGDQDYPIESGHSHTTICKPAPNFTKPLEFVFYGTSTRTASP